MIAHNQALAALRQCACDNRPETENATDQFVIVMWKFPCHVGPDPDEQPLQRHQGQGQRQKAEDTQQGRESAGQANNSFIIVTAFCPSA